MYQQNNKDVDGTNNEKSVKNIFGNFFENFINRVVGRTEHALPPPASSSATQNGESSRGGDEGFLEINIGAEVAEVLKKTFSDSSLIIPQGFQPVIEIPVALGRELYVAYVESIFRQQEVQNQILTECLREDEEFARQLQEDEKTIGKAPLEMFLKETDKYFVDDSESLGEERDDSIDDVDRLEQPAVFYRQQAQQYLNKRRQLYAKARQCLMSNNRVFANQYYEEAKRQTKLFEQFNNIAAATFLLENKERNRVKNTLDLHHLFVKEALQALDIFLDDEINSLESGSEQAKSLMVITGRGKHSVDGIPKIKPAVEERLRRRKLQYSEINPGLLKVGITKFSVYTSTLDLEISDSY